MMILVKEVALIILGEGRVNWSTNSFSSQVSLIILVDLFDRVALI